MIKNTENNHLIYYYNQDPDQCWREHDLDTTSMEIGICNRRPMTLKAELIRNARALYKDYPNLTIFMSGGLDCEMALRSFLAAGITPRIATVKFHGGTNLHDIGPMMKMLDSMGLSYTVINFDMEDFVYSGRCYEVGTKYQAYTLYQQMLLAVAESYKDPIITVDEIELEKSHSIDWNTGETKTSWVFLKKEDQDGCWRRFNNQTGIPALNNFYSYSPESMLAFLQIPIVDDLINDRIPGKLGWTSSKMQIYSTLGYEFRQRPKWFGVENLKHLWDLVEYNASLKTCAFNPRIYEVDALTLRYNLLNGKKTVCHIA
jgi:hypothetical protein